jgi:hypothetical protein
MKPDRLIDWERLKALALGLGLPHVVEATSWGNPCLKAHGKLWVWWSPQEDAPVFKTSFEEREILCEAEPARFFFTPHYKSWPLILMRPEAFDDDWARGNLVRAWRAQAPKKVLRSWDDAQAQRS